MADSITSQSLRRNRALKWSAYWWKRFAASDLRSASFVKRYEAECRARRGLTIVLGRSYPASGHVHQGHLEEHGGRIGVLSRHGKAMDDLELELFVAR